MNELTVYKNEMNTVPFRKFNSVEMNLFFAICTKMKNKSIQTVRFNFDDLKNISAYKSTSIDRLISDLDKTYTKMLSLIYKKEISKRHYEKFVLFTNFEINGDDKYIDISVNPKLAYVLNEISDSFTKFELEEFTNLRSSYSKTAFRLLKQFRLTGYWKIQIDEFRILFDVPKSYLTADVGKFVLKPIEKELSNIFKNLTIKKIKVKKQNKIKYLEFSFTPQDDIKKDGTKIFKDKNGTYYENDIEHFTKEEVNKSFPNK